ncbi:MAG: hypothetical protein OXH69_18135 [Acidobacteria bacterium]|nr:hypothetical protein [Acidobacteriota bacterium]
MARGRAGQDYAATSGMLFFQAGESSGKVEVALVDDAHDEWKEAPTRRLADP